MYRGDVCVRVYMCVCLQTYMYLYWVYALVRLVISSYDLAVDAMVSVLPAQRWHLLIVVCSNSSPVLNFILAVCLFTCTCVLKYS